MDASDANPDPPRATGVVFLDYDGVILTLRASLAQGCGYSRSTPDPYLCTVLRRVCQTGVRIVVSSSWRDEEKSTRAKLVEAGLDRFLHPDWKTREIRARQAHSDRPEEVAEWLSRHPEITDYRLLDDDPWAWTPEQKPRELRCCAENGADARVLKALLDWAAVPRPPQRLSLFAEEVR